MHLITPRLDTLPLSVRERLAAAAAEVTRPASVALVSAYLDR
jgi:hypothetical protein